MNCPIDSHSLEQKNFEGFEIDLCSSCHGLWFDEGQFLSAVNNITNLSLPEKYQLEVSKDAALPVVALHERRLRCPKDTSLLKTLNYGGDTNIFLDRCDTCHGVWLDGGEIALVKKDLGPKKMEEAIVGMFEEQWKEEEERKQLAETVASAPFLLFSPAFLVPVPDVFERNTYLPKITIALIFLAVFLNWRYPLGGLEKFFPWTAVVLYFWVFGKSVEKKLSFDSYVFLCALASLVGGFSTWFGSGIPVGSSPLVAMSSMVGGVMGAYLVFFPREKVKLFLRGRRFALPAWIYLTGWFIFQFIGIPSETTMGISFASNVAGFIFGIVFALLWHWLQKKKRI